MLLNYNTLRLVVIIYLHKTHMDSFFFLQQESLHFVSANTFTQRHLNQACCSLKSIRKNCYVSWCCTGWWVCCVVHPGHCPGEAKRGFLYISWVQWVWGSPLCVPQPHLSDLGCSLWRHRPTVPPPHWQERRQYPCEVGSKYCISNYLVSIF